MLGETVNCRLGVRITRAATSNSVGRVLSDRPYQFPVRAQELCESRGGRPGLSVLMSLTVSEDAKQH